MELDFTEKRRYMILAPLKMGIILKE